MLRFEDPIYLYMLLAVPALVLLRLALWRIRKKKLNALGDYALLKQLMPDVSKYRPTVKFYLLVAAYTMLVLLLARPQMGSKISREKRNGIEAIICLDISNSMLAQDVVPSRLDKSKMMIENLIDNFTNDKIGLVVLQAMPLCSFLSPATMFRLRCFFLISTLRLLLLRVQILLAP